jgi:hypothetical protein
MPEDRKMEVFINYMQKNLPQLRALVNKEEKW